MILLLCSSRPWVRGGVGVPACEKDRNRISGVGEREIVLRKTLVLVKSHIELNNE